MNKITFEFACLDDCLDKMVPSDLREVVAERDRLRERNEALEELVVGLEEVRSKEYEFKQARIEALEKDFAYHVELCTSQQARIGALTAEVEEQARLLGASGSREAELLARVEALEKAAQRRVDCGHDDECGGRQKDRCGCGHTELENALEMLLP